MIEAVTATNWPEFKAYARTWGPRHDESFIPAADQSFDPAQPAFLLRDRGRVVGAASLLVSESWARTGRGRFALLHAGADQPGSAEAYTALVSACRRVLPREFRELTLYLPDALATVRDHLAKLGFVSERIVSLMVRSTAASAEPSAPGYRLKALTSGDPEAIWFLEVRNRNFREVLGSHDQTLADVEERLTEDSAWPGGVNLLLDTEGRPCGTFALEKDDEPDSLFLATISVDKDRRGQGLGRFLVRSALKMAQEAGFARVFLSVNALNAQATRLYESEGFTLDKAMVCLVGPVKP